jgi:hypothetical protein
MRKYMPYAISCSAATLCFPTGRRSTSCHTAAPFCDERINLDISAYFQESRESYEAQAYEVKVRYAIDERSYNQSGVTGENWLYSPFSNTLSYACPRGARLPTGLRMN